MFERLAIYVDLLMYLGFGIFALRVSRRLPPEKERRAKTLRRSGVALIVLSVVWCAVRLVIEYR